MSRRVVLCLVLAAGVAALSAAVRRPDPASRPSAMVAAARAFLDGLGPDLRGRAAFAFDDAERRNWHFVPRDRRGLPLADMDAAQRDRAHALLRSVMSSQGYLKATTVMALDAVLRAMAEARGRRADHRDPEKYWFTVFGEPADDAPWGFRVEGHHLSLNVAAVAPGRVAVTPAFFGANPGCVREGPFAGLRALAREEDLAFALVRALDPDQRRRAILAQAALPDVLLQPDREAWLGEPDGLPLAAMTSAQRDLAWALIGEFTGNLRADLAGRDLERMRAEGDEAIHFAWAGATEPGHGHYFRVQGRAFAIEVANTQDGANHVHSLWRDRDNDFGAGMLRRHLEEHRGG